MASMDSTGPAPTPTDAPAVVRAGWMVIENPPGGSVLEVGSARLADGVIVQVGRSSHVRAELLGHFRERGLQGLVLVVPAGLAGGALLTHFALAPLRALEGTLRAILRTGRFDARVATQASSDPLDELGGLVNDMLGRIQVLLTGMRGALDNVAHDLRTPLTRFRSVAESALLADDPAALRDGLARALDEADRVNATLTALMDISEAETGTMALDRRAVDLAGVVREAIDLYADEAEDKGVTLESAVAAESRGAGRPHAAPPGARQSAGQRREVILRRRPHRRDRHDRRRPRHRHGA